MTTTNTLGTDNIKLVLKPFFRIIEATVEIDSNNDGKVSTMEGLNLIGIAGMAIMPVATQFDEFGAEAKDLTLAEASDLLGWAEVEFPNLAKHPKFSTILKGAVKFIRSGVEFVQTVKAA